MSILNRMMMREVQVLCYWRSEQGYSYEKRYNMYVTNYEENYCM